MFFIIGDYFSFSVTQKGIDNAVVEVDASEIPIMDGSAVEFVDAIRSVGVKEQTETRKFIKVLLLPLTCVAKYKYSNI